MFHRTSSDAGFCFLSYADIGFCPSLLLIFARYRFTITMLLLLVITIITILMCLDSEYFLFFLHLPKTNTTFFIGLEDYVQSKRRG